MPGDKPPVSGKGNRPPFWRSILPEARQMRPSNGSGEGESASQTKSNDRAVRRDLRPGEIGSPNASAAEITGSPDVPPKGLSIDRVPEGRWNRSKEWTKAEIESAWGRLIESRSRRAEPKFTAGEELARRAGYPPAEEGYHWTNINGKPAYQRNAYREQGPEGNREPNPNALRAYNPEIRRFENVLSASEVAEALELPDAPPRYHWELRKDGTLIIQRDTIDVVPQLVYDAKIDNFVPMNADVIEPRLGPKQILALKEVNEASLQEMERLLAQRSEAKQRRNLLEIQEGTSSASEAEAAEIAPAPGDKTELTQARYVVNEASRQLGERAAEAYMLSQRAAEAYMLRTYGSQGAMKIYQLGEIGSAEAYSRSGDFDQVWEVINKDSSLPSLTDASSWTIYRDGTTLVVVEAKGGNSRLETRNVTLEIGEVRPCRQGSRPYLVDVANNMMLNKDEHISAVGKAVLQALDKHQVRYIVVQAPIGQVNNKDVLRDIVIREFDIDSGYAS